MKKFDLTAEGLQKYKDELDELVNIKRPEVIQEIKDAKAQGDLSENADYDAARKKQGEIEDRITELKEIVNNARIIEQSNSDTVALGSTVTIRVIETNKENTYLIVGPAEADPVEGKISNACPVAQAIIGHGEGETVTVKVAKPYNVQIVKIAKN